jgi:hypothetical protein
VGNSVILFASRNVSDRTVMINRQKYKVECECHYVPFSNHTDSLGIIDVLRRCNSRVGVVLVHGQRDKMERFKVQLAALLGDPSVRIEIPNNHDVLEFQVSIGDERQTACTEEIVSKDYAMRFEEVIEIIRTQFSHWIFTPVEDEISFRDDRCTITVGKRDRRTRVSFATRPQLEHEEWSRFNPMFVGLDRLLKSHNFDGISECSA